MYPVDERLSVFEIIEQRDGRYIVVEQFGEYATRFTTRKGETIVMYEEDCRSTAQCYAAIADSVVNSGMYLDSPTVIRHIRYGETE